MFHHKSVFRPYAAVCAVAMLLSVFMMSCGAWYGVGVQQRQAIPHLEKMDASLAHGDYERFIALATDNGWYTQDRNSLILNLDTGAARIYAGDYTTGVDRLLTAMDTAEDYYTKSVTTEALTVLTNDLTRPYYGEDYEITFAGIAACVGFAAQGRTEEALVEARRIEHRLTVLADSYEGTDKYKDDAFGHYLAGLLFEATGDYNSALVAYKKAWFAYNTRFYPFRPETLIRDLAGVTVAMGAEPDFGFASVIDSLRVSDPHVKAMSIPKSRDGTTDDTMIIVAFTGRGPRKVENVTYIEFPYKNAQQQIKIALPEIHPQYGSISGVRVRLPDGSRHELVLAADYNHIGVEAFSDKADMIYAKTFARVTARYIAMRQVKDKALADLRKRYNRALERYGPFSGEAVAAQIQLNATSLAIDALANELLEHADTRSSLALPGRAYVGRVAAPGESFALTIEYLDRAGRVIAQENRQVSFSPRTRVLTLGTSLQ